MQSKLEDWNTSMSKSSFLNLDNPYRFLHHHYISQGLSSHPQLLYAVAIDSILVAPGVYTLVDMSALMSLQVIWEVSSAVQ